MTGRGWAYVGAVLGASVSIAANVAHSYVPPEGAAPHWAPQPGAVAMSVFWPVAVLVALEILGRVVWPSGARWLIVRWGGLTPVGLVAAVVSYRHLSGLLDWYGEDAVTSRIGPLAVDGLMLLSSAALLVRTVHHAARTAGQVVTASPTGAVSDTVTDTVTGALSDTDAAPAADAVSDTTTTTATDDMTGTVSDTVSDTDAAPAADAVSDSAPAPARRATRTKAVRSTGRRRPSTAERIALVRERHPDWSPAEIARRVKVTERTVHRYLRDMNRDTVSVPDEDHEPGTAGSVEVAA